MRSVTLPAGLPNWVSVVRARPDERHHGSAPRGRGVAACRLLTLRGGGERYYRRTEGTRAAETQLEGRLARIQVSWS